MKVHRSIPFKRMQQSSKHKFGFMALGSSVLTVRCAQAQPSRKYSDLHPVILILRTSAIWGNDSRIAIGLGTLLLMFALTGGYFVARYNNSLEFVPNPFAAAPAYIVTRVDTLIFVPYATFVAFETVVLVLTLWMTKQQNGKCKTYQTLYRDCVLFYIFLLAISLVNISLLIEQQGVQKLLVTQ